MYCAIFVFGFISTLPISKRGAFNVKRFILKKINKKKTPKSGYNPFVTA